jgi:MFS family permease
MLVGSVAGGVIAQVTDLGVPYIVRAALLGVTVVVAWLFMKDIGFTPERGATPIRAVRTVLDGAIQGGLRNRPVRWLMLAAPFTTGVGFYAFYALQPYLLELYGDPEAYQVAGLVAAIVAGSQILGGLTAPRIRRLFQRRTSALIAIATLSTASLALIGVADSFWPVIGLIAAWGLLFAANMPIRQAYLNGMIPSQQRATIISFDSLMSSSGGVWTQPALGRAADAWGYAPTYLIGAAISAVAVPALALSRREDAPADSVRPAPATAC